MKNKPDDYYTNGIFELARFGNNVVLKNNMTPEMHEKYLSFLAEKYDEKTKLINKLIEKIRKNVSICDAEQLMNFIISMRQVSMINKASESEYSSEDNELLNVAEYIQSIIVADGAGVEDQNEDQNELYSEVLENTIELYKETKSFLVIWGAKKRLECKNQNIEDLMYIFEAQLFSYVRGDRYQVFQIPYYEELLMPYDEYFKEIYNSSAQEILDGLQRLEKALSTGRIDSLNELNNLFEKFSICKTDQEKENFRLEYEEKNSKLAHEAFGIDLFNIKKITGWPDGFISDLTFDAGENKELFQHEQFPGWPIWNLPVERRPFVRIKGIVYGFDYYIVFDNLYRAIQRAIRGKGGKYEDGWGKIQQKTSETLVGKLFQKIIPCSELYIGNYYKKDFENDILLIYKDVLIIAEVKAGAFAYTPALTDLEAHKSSFETLVNKAGKQCKRTLDYLDSKERVDFYDAKGNKKVSIRKKDYSQVYSFCVSIDDFNVFAAHAEKVKYVKLRSGTISLSVNDLWVYSEYFKSSIKFIHFLKQRAFATTVPELALRDELDHLGLYIQNNMYSITAKQMGQGQTVEFNGFRKDLDYYFSAQYNTCIKAEKPEQKMPELFEQICRLEEKSEFSSTLFTNFILDFSLESKINFANSVSGMLTREKEIGIEIVGINAQNVCYCLFVYQPDIQRLSKQRKLEYSQGLMIYHNMEQCWMIELEFDGKGKITNVISSLILKQDIKPEQYDELYEIGKCGVESRKNTYLIRNGQKKVYPNDLCPCGSGKKYKKCCGKRKNN